MNHNRKAYVGSAIEFSERISGAVLTSCADVISPQHSLRSVTSEVDTRRVLTDQASLIPLI